MPETKIKHAGFHRAYLLQDGARKDPGEQPWEELLQKVAELTMEERTVDGLIYEPTLLDRGTLMGMHKPLNPDFMSRIDSEAGSIADFMDRGGATEAEGDNDQGAEAGAVKPERFANSTAVYFLPIGNVIAISLGNREAPRANRLAAFLDEFLPPESPNASWRIEALVDNDEILKLKEAKGVVQFSTRFNTSRNLFSEDAAQPGIYTFAEKMAAQIGGDLELTIDVKLTPEARNRSNKGKLMQMLMRDLPRLTGKDSKASAKALLEEGVEEQLSLVAHSLAADFEINKLAMESHQFSELLKALGDVGDEMHTRVKTILDGVE